MPLTWRSTSNVWLIQRAWSWPRIITKAGCPAGRKHGQEAGYDERDDGPAKPPVCQTGSEDLFNHAARIPSYRKSTNQLVSPLMAPAAPGPAREPLIDN